MNKKITTAALTAAAILSSCVIQQMSLTAFAADDTIAIDEANFPDPNFRAIVTADYIDTDMDDMLSADEIAAVTALNVSDQGITDLTGLENFTSLTELNCRNNALTTLDVCFFPSLIILNCDNNALTEIDLLNNTDLELFSCEGNDITTLDLSKNTALTDIDCSGNKLTSLYLRYNEALSTLDYSGNAYPLSGLSLDEITEYGFDPECATAWNGAEYDADTNSLTNVTKSTITYTYEVGNDRIATFSLVLKPSGLFALSYDTSAYLGWDEFDGATAYSVSYNDGAGDILYADDLTDNYCVIDGLTNETEYTFEVKAYVDGVWTEAAYVTETPDVLVSIDEDTFPDDTFREFVQSLDDNENGILDIREIEAVTTLTLTDMEITDLAGIECFSSLVELNCDGCALTELDVSENTALETLNCSDNELTKLDVSENSALTSLVCSNNKLVKIDLGEVQLETLDCSDNQLTSLSINDMNLQSFNAEGNSYTLNALSLDELAEYGFDPEKVSEWSGAEYDEETNSLTNIAGSEITYTYNVSGFHSAEFVLNIDTSNVRARGYYKAVSLVWNKTDKAEKYAVTYTDGTSEMTVNDITDTFCTIDELKNGTEYTFVIKAYANDAWTSFATVTATPAALVNIDETNFPDDIFRGIVTSNDIDTNEDDMLSVSEIEAVQELDVSECEIADLSGIEYLTALVEINCKSNDLTKLDVRNNVMLETLDCDNNAIAELYVSNNVALTYLSCLNNELTELDLSKNTSLDRLNCEWNNITSLDISNCTELTELYASGNALTELDAGKCTKLITLYCDINDLTKLDISSCTELEYLDCEDNFLTELDLSKNTTLATLSCGNNQLTHLDISNTAVTSENFSCSYNFYALDSASLADLTECGFDGSKTSDWTGATYNAETNSLTDVTSDTITYTYDVGKEIEVTFTLDFDITKPHNVKAVADDGQVTVTWDAVDGATKYAVFYGTDTEELTAAAEDITSTEYTVTNLTNDTTYYFAVKAYVNDKWSELSATVAATPESKAMEVPVITSATVNGTTVNLAWTAVAGATSYRVYRADSETGTKTLIKTVGNPYTTDSTVTAGKTYYYFIAAYNSKTGELTDYSAAQSVTVPSTFTAPTITSATVDGTTVSLAWTAVDGATSYRVYRADSETGTKTLIKTVGNAYTYDATVTAGKTYYYFVAAYNSKTGELTEYSAGESVTVPATLAAPTITSATSDGKTVNLAWNAVDGATSYRVYRADSATGTKTLLKTVSNPYTYDATVTAGKTYYYFVAAYSSKTATLSAYSAAKSVTVAASLSAPTITSATADGTTVNLAWTAVDGATSYRVYRADSATGTKTLIKTVGNAYTYDATVTAGKTYYYFVAAYSSKTATLSAYSAAKSVTVAATLAAPTITSATSDGKTVNLAWNAVDGATSYRVYRADSATGTKTLIKTVGNAYTYDATVTAGKTYYYFVAAYSSKTATLSAYSAAKSVTVAATLAAPTITTATTNGTTVNLAWNAVDGATSYRVYRADSATGTKTLLKTVGNAYTYDATVTAGETYYYFVAAYSSKTGTLSAYSAAKAVTALATPVITSATSANGTVNLAWNKVTGATSYRVYRATSATGTKTLLKTVGNPYTYDATVSEGTTYYYFIVAYDSQTGTVSTTSAAAEVTAE